MVDVLLLTASIKPPWGGKQPRGHAGLEAALLLWSSSAVGGGGVISMLPRPPDQSLQFAVGFDGVHVDGAAAR